MNTALSLMTPAETIAASNPSMSDLTAMLAECTKAMEVIAGADDEAVAKKLADGMAEVLKALAKRIEG
jgi:thiamine monophosphate kinase